MRYGEWRDRGGREQPCTHCSESRARHLRSRPRRTDERSPRCPLRPLHPPHRRPRRPQPANPSTWTRQSLLLPRLLTAIQKPKRPRTTSLPRSPDASAVPRPRWPQTASTGGPHSHPLACDSRSRWRSLRGALLLSSWQTIATDGMSSGRALKAQSSPDPRNHREAMATDEKSWRPTELSEIENHRPNGTWTELTSVLFQLTGVVLCALPGRTKRNVRERRKPASACRDALKSPAWTLIKPSAPRCAHPLSGSSAPSPADGACVCESVDGTSSQPTCRVR
jgi:hypothetical protein